MSIIPLRQKDAPLRTAPGQNQTGQPLKSVRLKEIVPVYSDVTIVCPAGACLTDWPAIHSAADVYQLFAFLEYETREQFFALHLNARHEILCLDQVSLGSLTASIVTPRDVYKSALLSSAAAILFVHNHPSGEPTPSRDDQQIYQRLKEAGELLSIRVLDSVVVGNRGRYVSMASLHHVTRPGALPGDDPPALFV
jgi:DNA repair protein RadC